MEFDKEQESSDIICDACHKTFRDIGSVKLHQCVHTGKRPYCCDVCNKTFSNKRNLKVHQLVHTGECPYNC
jgi:KRAB domain-containing zinc finger protein